MLYYNLLNTLGILLNNCLSTGFPITSCNLSSIPFGNSAASVRFFQYLYLKVTSTPKTFAA